VIGSAIGWLGPVGGGWAPLLGANGSLYPGKVEGVSIDPDEGVRLWAVVDADDPIVPAKLCQIELTGPWPFTRSDSP
jgi:hypothetical protein